MDKLPRVSDLNQRIVLGYDTQSVNENGYPESTEHEIAEVWAMVTDAGQMLYTDSRYFRAGDAMNSEKSARFVIRWRDDIKPGIWIKFRGTKWSVTGVNEYSYGKNYLNLKALFIEGTNA